MTESMAVSPSLKVYPSSQVSTALCSHNIGFTLICLLSSPLYWVRKSARKRRSQKTRIRAFNISVYVYGCFKASGTCLGLFYLTWGVLLFMPACTVDASSSNAIACTITNGFSMRFSISCRSCIYPLIWFLSVLNSSLMRPTTRSCQTWS